MCFAHAIKWPSKYIAKFEFVVGKGLGKDQQGITNYIPTPHPVNGKRIDYTGERKKHQWRRVPHPTHTPIRAIDKVYQGLPELVPFQGTIYPGFEIFRDVVDFSEYASGYKEVNLLEAKPEQVVSVIRPVK